MRYLLLGFFLSTSLFSLRAGTFDDLAMLDHRGKEWTAQDFQSDSVVVVAFLGTECPLAKLYAVRLGEIAKDFQANGVQVVAVMSNRQDSLEEIGSFVMRQEIAFPVMKDTGNQFADALGAKRTPEIFVFDAKRELRYRGRVDDQYGIGYVRDEPRRKDLRIALSELTSGQDVSVASTKAVGCIIGRTKPTDASSKITYGSHVAKILNDRCVNCHREGEIAPFSLTDYDEVAGWSDMIAEVVREGRMPPWHATSDHSEFANDRSMPDEEKQALYDWAESGAPAGDVSDLPQLAAKTLNWRLPRKPDRVIPVSPQPFDVPASGAVRYQYFKFDPEFDEEVWLQAAELKPGNREVVHHILAFALPKGNYKGINAARGFLVGYVPGQDADVWPVGHAKRIPAGSELVFQVHYTPIGTPQIDHSELGLCFVEADSVTHEVVTTSAVQSRLRIPAGDANYTTDARSPAFPENARLLSMSPHMHVRGKSFRYDLISSEGKQRILDIPEYDFNWQTSYKLAEPLSVDAGSHFLCTAVFDNSESNLNNPDPTVMVKWGDQTWDEMMIGYFNYAVPVRQANVQDKKKMSARQRARQAADKAARLATYDKLDRDGDGKLSKTDTPRKLHPIFDELDANGDGLLMRVEVQQ